MIHSDVCGPMRTPPPSGMKYVLTFIDDYSRFSVVYLLKEKSEAFPKFREFISMCETNFRTKPKWIRTDRGGEYMGKQFIDYLQQKGIQFNGGLKQ